MVTGRIFIEFHRLTRFFIVCFCALVAIFPYPSILSLDPPVEPIPPNVELADKKEISKKDSKKEKNLKSTSIIAKLCDGRQVAGNIEYEKEELFFQHTKEGIKYDKKLRITDIKQIKIQSWELKKGKKVKDGTAYQAFPAKVLITNSSGENFLVKGLQDTEFLNLNVSNQNGVAKLYTYWLDLLYDNGSWYSKLSTISGQEREDCYPDVIRTIQFN